MQIEPDADALHPVKAYLPTWSPRRIADAARAKRLPGAVKVGRQWMLRRSDFERWLQGGSAAPTVADAEAELRKRGLV